MAKLYSFEKQHYLVRWGNIIIVHRSCKKNKIALVISTPCTYVLGATSNPYITAVYWPI